MATTLSYENAPLEPSSQHLSTIHTSYDDSTVPKHMDRSSTTSLQSLIPSTKPHYDHIPTQPDSIATYEREDLQLKQRIRHLKLLSRLLGTLLSLATFIPLLLTLLIFTSTRSFHKTVNGRSRTAWAAGTILWPHIMYFSLACVSLVLNGAILVSYVKGIRTANRAANVAGWYSGAVLVGHVIVWGVGSALYRVGREPVGGRERDLWGWTCSAGAAEIQGVFREQIDFGRYCRTQVCMVGADARGWEEGC